MHDRNLPHDWFCVVCTRTCYDITVSVLLPSFVRQFLLALVCIGLSCSFCIQLPLSQ